MTSPLETLQDTPARSKAFRAGFQASIRLKQNRKDRKVCLVLCGDDTTHGETKR